MRNIYKLLCLVVVLSSFFAVQFNNEVIAAAPQKAAKTAPVVAPQMIVAPTTVVNNPSKYLNKNITFTANFITFTSLGLDYKPAYKDPEWQAKALAGELMMPRNLIKNYTIEQIAQKCGVSIEGAKVHYKLIHKS